MNKIKNWFFVDGISIFNPFSGIKGGVKTGFILIIIYTIYRLNGGQPLLFEV